MIHNIREERKRRYHTQSPLTVPFTEEELTRLIRQVEEQELLHAPKHLREDIFAQIDREKQQRKSWQLFSYRAKVLAGMAAALAVLFLVPADGMKITEKPQDSILSNLLPKRETEEIDAWEQEAAERQRNIDKVWAQYRDKEERAEARKQYLKGLTEKLENETDREDIL